MAVSTVSTPLRPIDDTDSSRSGLCLPRLLALDVDAVVVVVVRLHLRLFCAEVSCNLIELAALEAVLTRFVCSVFVVVVVLVAVGLILF